MTTLGAQVGIADGRPVLFARESVGEPRIGLESRWTAVKLPLVAQEDSGASVHGPHQAADAHIPIPVFAQFANLVVILPQAHNGEPAALVRRVGHADVQKARAVGKLNYIIDMRRNTNVFVEHFSGLFGGEARLLAGGKGCSG